MSRLSTAFRNANLRTKLSLLVSAALLASLLISQVFLYLYVAGTIEQQARDSADTVMTQVDIDAFTVHPNVMDVVECYEVVRGPAKGELRARSLDDPIDHVLARELGLPAVRLIRCGGDDPIASEREQWNDGSNTLAVAPGKVFVYQRNSVTNDIMAKAGLELLEVPSAELSRGRGGPHCMSMAFWRDPVE